MSPHSKFTLERVAQRDLKGSRRVLLAGVEVFPIFKAEWADDGFPANTAAHGVQACIKRIVVDMLSQAQRIRKGDDRPLVGKRLFQFNRGQAVALGADNLTLGIAG